jgi:large subunit ribosomal protein L25
MAIEIAARKRQAQGTSASRRLRRGGSVPAIVYGGKQDPECIELDQNAIFQALRQEKFHASVLTLKLEERSEQVLLRSFNMHPWRPLVQHVDFQRVRADEPIHMKVPLHFINAEISPAVKTSAAVVSHVMNEVDIRCLPADLPEFISIDLKDLTAGASVHLRDITLPKGVEPAVYKNENPVVVTAMVPRGAVEEEKTAEGATPASAVPASKQPEKADAAKGGDKGGAAKGGKK